MGYCFFKHDPLVEITTWGIMQTFQTEVARWRRKWQRGRSSVFPGWGDSLCMDVEQPGVWGTDRNRGWQDLWHFQSLPDLAQELGRCHDRTPSGAHGGQELEDVPHDTFPLSGCPFSAQNLESHNGKMTCIRLLFMLWEAWLIPRQYAGDNRYLLCCGQWRGETTFW